MEINSAAPFRAVVDGVQFHQARGSDGVEYLAIKIRLHRDDGSLVNVATDRATLTQVAFSQNLVKGQAYEWPKAINDFKTAAVLAKRERFLHSPLTNKAKETK